MRDSNRKVSKISDVKLQPSVFFSVLLIMKVIDVVFQVGRGTSGLRDP